MPLSEPLAHLHRILSCPILHVQRLYKEENKVGQYNDQFLGSRLSGVCLSHGLATVQRLYEHRIHSSSYDHPCQQEIGRAPGPFPMESDFGGRVPPVDCSKYP